MNKNILIFDQAESAGGSIARAVDIAILTPEITFFFCTVHPLKKLYSRDTTNNIHQVRVHSFYNYPKKYKHTKKLYEITSNKFLRFIGRKCLAVVDLLNEISMTMQLRLKLFPHNIDLVQANAGPHFLPYKIANIKKSGLIYYFRHLDEYGWAKGDMLDRASHYIFVGRNLMDKIRSSIKLDDEKCHVIHSPFDVNERLIEEKQPSAEDESLFRKGQEKHVVSVGRICPEKGQHITLEAMAMLPSSCPPIKLIFIGEASKTHKAYEARLHQFVAEKKLSNQVFFLGYRSNPLKLLRQADISIQAPIYFEALAGSLVEPLQLGIPTISADSGGANEVILHGKTGLLFPVEDSKALAAHIETLITDPALSAELAKEGKVYATEKWNKQHICLQLYKIYGDACAANNL